ncbi:hypothetical protein INT44_005402 [Umbelopsis vinacea]|uniref:Uncharacterized protein n=1 Tax=Umbelopsis vinacea TaxID=44442 RepID=A0A8H7Q809_9FUNG|nr:hypothetical protein INT44_005402 [Umbelopsis vinacea]
MSKPSLPGQSTKTTTQHQKIVLAFRQEQLQRDRRDRVLMNGCRPTIGTEPILTAPATRKERSRLLRWRLDWLPGQPRDCLCRQDRLTRKHVLECQLIPAHLWDTLSTPPPDSNQNTIDFALSALTISPTSPPPYWSDLLSILRLVDRYVHSDTVFPEEPAPGET